MMSSKSIFEIGTDSSKQLLQEGYTSQEANGLQQLLLATALHGTQHAGFSREVNIGIVHINKTWQTVDAVFKSEKVVGKEAEARRSLMDLTQQVIIVAVYKYKRNGMKLYVRNQNVNM